MDPFHQNFDSWKHEVKGNFLKRASNEYKFIDKNLSLFEDSTRHFKQFISPESSGSKQDNMFTFKVDNVLWDRKLPELENQSLDS